jgi:hypothetical protein
VLDALTWSQSDRAVIDNDELRSFKKVLRKQSMIRRFKIKKGGMSCTHLDFGVDGGGNVIEGEEGVVSQEGVQEEEEEEDFEYDSDDSKPYQPPSPPKSLGPVHRKSTLLIDEDLPPLKQRYGLEEKAFLKEPVCLKSNRLQSMDVEKQLNAMVLRGAADLAGPSGGDSTVSKRASLSVASEISFTSVETIAARRLKKKNFQLLEGFQKPDPRLNNNKTRKKVANQTESSLAGIAKLKAEVEEKEKGDANDVDVTEELQKYYKNMNLGLGWQKSILPFVRRKKRAEDKNWGERMVRAARAGAKRAGARAKRERSERERERSERERSERERSERERSERERTERERTERKRPEREQTEREPPQLSCLFLPRPSTFAG